MEINLLNEAGGREVILRNDLSSQFAHLMCLHRHRPKLVEVLAVMSRQAAARVRADRGQVGRGALIRLVPEIVNVNLGEQARVVGALRLVDGSVLSSARCALHDRRGCAGR